MYNTQGNYDQGRGADGLSRVFVGSRYGSGIPTSNRPARISGKPTPPPLLDPKLRLQPGETGEGFTGPQPGRRRRKITPTIARIPTARRQRRPNKAAITRHRRQFINWMKQWSPSIYAGAKNKADMVDREETGLGNLSGWWETFTDSIGDLGSKVLQYKTQKEILDVQMERMRAGLPPLQTGEYAPTFAVKVDPGTTQEITGAIGAGFGKMLPFIAIGGVALVLLMRRR